MGSIRSYEFIVGPETSELPVVGTPTEDTDLVNKGYSDSHYVQGGAPVADLTALKALDVGDRTDNDVIFCDGKKSFYQYDSSSSDTDDGDFVVTPDVGSGRWIKISAIDPLTKNLSIPGNLTVDGTLTTVNSTTLEVTDANILVNNGGTQSTANSGVAGLTIEMSNATDARIGYDSSLASKFKCGVQGAEHELLTDGTNQDIDGIKSFKKPVTMLEVSSTPTTPSTGYKGIYAKTDGKVYTIDDSGNELEVGSGASGGGSLNYIENPNAASNNTDNWSTYNDASGDTPTDGTGGTASNLTLSTVGTPDNLRGDYSFKLQSTVSTSNGQGVSTDFTIDKVDKNKRLSITFDLLTSSGYIDNDIGVWIYDKDNATLLTETEYLIPYTNGYPYSVQTSFISTDSVNYTLIFHIRTSNHAYSFYFDNVSVGPYELIQTTPITEWTAFTPVFDTITISSSSSYYRRVGDTMEIFSQNAIATNTGGATDILLTLPNGLTIDASKTNSSTPNLGNLAYYDSSTSANSETGWVGPSPYSNKIKFFTNLYGNIQGNNPFVWASGDSFNFNAKVPIAEWAGSSTSLANNRVEYASNSSVTTSNDSTSFSYGPAGNLIPPVSSSGINGIRKRINFLTPLQPTDKLSLQINIGSNGSNQWIDVGDYGYSKSQNDAGTSRYGMSIEPSAANNDVYFWGPGPFPGSDSWSTLNSNGYRWRVVKSTNPLSIRSGIVMPTEMTKEESTKMGRMIYLGDSSTTYNGGNTISITGGTSVTSQLSPYQMQDGSWRLRFNIKITMTSWNHESDGSETSILHISGIKFPNTFGSASFKQAVACSRSSLSTSARGSATPNTDNITISSTNSAASGVTYLSGDVALDSKPTWAY